MSATGQLAFDKVVVIGHTGMIGSALMRVLATRHGSIERVGLSLAAMDITTPEGMARIAPHLGPGTAIVMCAAIKRQLGDSADIYLKNTAIAVGFANLIAAHPVRRVVYLSSAAVYGEDIENLAISEATPVNARSYYGLSKTTAEWLIERAAQAHPAMSVGLVRPATIYGPGDVGTAYGPSGFLTAAVEGKPITLWGDGSELREFIYIDDAAEALARYVFVDHRGPLNLVAGQSYSFQDALAAATKAAGRTPAVTSRPRSKDKVDNRFDNALLRRLVPGLTFRSLDDGVAAMHAARYGSAKGGS